MSADTSKKHGWIRGAILSVGILAIGGLVSYIFVNIPEEVEYKEKVESISYVYIDDVNYGSYDAKITAYGRLNANKKADIFAETGGRLSRGARAFKEGAYFPANSVIFRIDDEEARLSLYSQRSDFLNILISLMADLKSDYPGAFPEWQEYLNNYSIEKTLDSLPEVNREKLKFFLASRNIYRSYYSIKNLEYRLTKYAVRAPFSGTVSSALAEPGMNVMPGQRLGSMISSGGFELELSLDKQEAEYIKTGGIVEVSSLEAGRQWRGRIARISSQLDPSSQTVSVYVSISGKGLKDGMYLKGEIAGGEMENVYQIPRKAVYNNSYVYTVKDSSLAKENIELVRISGDYAFIRGLEPQAKAVVENLENPIVGARTAPVYEENND